MPHVAVSSATVLVPRTVQCIRGIGGDDSLWLLLTGRAFIRDLDFTRQRRLRSGTSQRAMSWWNAEMSNWLPTCPIGWRVRWTIAQGTGERIVVSDIRW